VWLRQAASRSLSAALSDLTQGNAAGWEILCKRGLTIVSATDGELSQLRQAVQPVYEDLERSAQTRAFIDEITTMRDGIGEAPDAVPPCGGSPNVTKTTTVTALDGTWEASFTRKELLAISTDPGEDNPGNYGHFTLTFHKGDYVYINTTSNGSESGTYVVDGNTLILKVSSGEVWSMLWSIYRDTLTLTGGIPTPLRVKPWRRVGP
jgi:hypothetical protein